MNTKHLQTLELNKILNKLSEHCASDGAKQAALSLIPANKLSDADRLLTQTEDAYILTARFGSPSFAAVKNVDNALSRASAGGMLNMGELLTIAGVLRSVRMITEWRSRSEGVKTSLDYMFNSLYSNKYFENRIFTCILSEEEMSDNASPELFNIRRKMSAASNKIREKLDAMIRSSAYQKFLQDPVVTIRSGRFVVPVKSECRSEIAGLVHDTSSSGATVFVEPMAVVEANNEIKVLKSAEANEIERILYELSEEAASFSEGIKTSSRIMEQLDLIFAKAKLGFDMKATRPILNDKGIIDLKKARHPLLDKSTVVPVDIVLGKDYDTLVITGPNTGGKTVTLKAMGLMSLMAMCGMLIPVSDNSEISVFDNVLADIGDEQSIEQSLSTFSSHIKNIISIMDSADNNTLVLLDELCSGTDPVEGAALAVAILENLREKGATIAATTHYAELKAYALDTKGVENACCEFDVETLAPTYRLLIGVPGRSNAFANSRKLGIHSDVIDNAKSLVNVESSRFERVVEELEATRKRLEQKEQAAESMRIEAKRLSKEAKEKSDALRDEYNKELQKARDAARVIVDNAHAEVNRILDELEQIKKQQKGDISAARAAAKAGFKKLDSMSVGENYKEDYTLPRELKVGDTVTLADIGSKATVLSLPDSQSNVMVQAGIIKMKTALSNLRLIEESGIVTPKPKRTYTSGIEAKAARRAALEFDIRGQNVEEATLELDRFIDNALMNGMSQFTVIHGKGTGALRAGIHKFLKSHKSVRSFRLGVFGEGEAGVTIVELK